MNTTIITLAANWWNKLSINKRCESTKKYYPKKVENLGFNRAYLDLRMGHIENIFYNEVVMIWFNGLTYDYKMKITDSDFKVSAERIKELYLKEHWVKPTAQEKEQILKERNTVIERNTEYPLTPNDCFKEHTKEQPITALCENGSNLTFDDACNLISEQPQSVDNTIDVQDTFDFSFDPLKDKPAYKIATIKSVLKTIDVEEHKCEYGGAMNIQSDDECYAKPKVFPVGTIVRDMHNLNEDEFDKPCYTKLKDGKWKLGSQKYFTIDANSIGENKRFKLISIPPQPKAIEDNVWDEARRGYKKLTHRSILSNGEHALLDYMEQHYSLIKK
jgi:hypothetical protein